MAPPPTGGARGYVLDNAAAGELDRLRALEAAYDPTSAEHLARLGVGPGALVLFAGAGAGGLVSWAAGRGARVTAVDLDPRFVEPLASDTVSVHRADITTDPLPGAGYDVVHTRLLLGHLPDPAAVLARLAGALRPGGALLAEEYDWASYGPSFPSEGSTRTIAAFTRVLADGGFDPDLGRRLPTLLRRLGLDGVDAVGRVLTLRGTGAPTAAVHRQTFAALVPKVLAAGLLTQDDLAAFAARMADPDFDALTPTMVSVWGRTT
jgi:SAM-dependent methyltransferase